MMTSSVFQSWIMVFKIKHSSKRNAHRNGHSNNLILVRKWKVFFYFFHFLFKEHRSVRKHFLHGTRYIIFLSWSDESAQDLFCDCLLQQQLRVSHSLPCLYCRKLMLLASLITLFGRAICLSRELHWYQILIFPNGEQNIGICGIFRNILISSQKFNRPPYWRNYRTL